MPPSSPGSGNSPAAPARPPHVHLGAWPPPPPALFQPPPCWPPPPSPPSLSPPIGQGRIVERVIGDDVLAKVSNDPITRYVQEQNLKHSKRVSDAPSHPSNVGLFVMISVVGLPVIVLLLPRLLRAVFNVYSCCCGRRKLNLRAQATVAPAADASSRAPGYIPEYRRAGCEPCCWRGGRRAAPTAAVPSPCWRHACPVACLLVNPRSPRVARQEAWQENQKAGQEGQETSSERGEREPDDGRPSLGHAVGKASRKLDRRCAATKVGCTG